MCTFNLFTLNHVTFSSTPQHIILILLATPLYAHLNLSEQRWYFRSNPHTHLIIIDHSSTFNCPHKCTCILTLSHSPLQSASITQRSKIGFLEQVSLYEQCVVRWYHSSSWVVLQVLWLISIKRLCHKSPFWWWRVPLIFIQTQDSTCRIYLKSPQFKI